MRAVSGCVRISDEIDVSVLNRKCGLIWLASASILRRQQQLLLLLQPVLDARVVPDLDRRGDAEHRREQDDEQRPATRRFGARGRTGDGARRTRRRAPGASSSSADRREQQDDLPVDLQAAGPSARRCGGRSVKTNGEKCQIASFGHSSRRPPPAKPQPTAKGSAIHSPATSGGRPTIDADDARRRRDRRSGRRGTRPRASGRRRCSSRSRRATTPAVSGMPRLSAKISRSGQSRRSKIRMCRNRR